MPVVGDMLRSPVAHKLPGAATTSKEDKEAYNIQAFGPTGRTKAGIGFAWMTSISAVSLAAANCAVAIRCCLEYPRTTQAGMVFCPANDIKGLYADSSLSIDPISPGRLRLGGYRRVLG